MNKSRSSKYKNSLFKRNSQSGDNNSDKKINIKILYETFKESQIDFLILNSLIKLNDITNKKNTNNANKNELISTILENMKKKNLFFFFCNFYKINDDLMKKIIPHLAYEFYPKNAHLYNENDFSDKFYFIIKGFVTFHRNEIIVDSEKNSSIVDVEKFLLGPNKFFGEIDLIYDKRKALSAFCKTECHLITITKEYFKKFLEEKISKIELEKKLYIFSFFKKFSLVPTVKLEKYVINNVQTLFFRRNKIIYKAGEKNINLYLIYKGETVIINDIKKGEFFNFKNFNEKIRHIQKRAIGLDYVNMINNTNIKNDDKYLYDKKYNKKDINNDEELDDLNYLMDKNKYDVINRMTKGGVGGLEIVTGSNCFKYSLISNSDFTCVLKLELKNIDEYLTGFLINLIPLFVNFEKNIHERIKNFRLIDENITPSSVKKIKKSRNELIFEKKNEEENDKIYKKNIQKIDDSFQLNYGGFIKNNGFNFDLFQKKEHFKELLKKNKKKIFEIQKYLKYLDEEEKLNLKYTEFKMQKNQNVINDYKNKNINITKQKANLSLKKSKKNLVRLMSTRSLKNHLKINLESDSFETKRKKILKFKRPKLIWKFFDTETRKLRKNADNIDTINIINPKIKEVEKNKKKDSNILYEKMSLSIDDNYKKKVFICSNSINKIKNKYKTKEILVLTPIKDKQINKFNSEQKLFFQKNHIRNIKKIFLYDTGKFDIPLLSSN